MYDLHNLSWKINIRIEENLGSNLKPDILLQNILISVDEGEKEGIYTGNIIGIEVLFDNNWINVYLNDYLLVTLHWGFSGPIQTNNDK